MTEAAMKQQSAPAVRHNDVTMIGQIHSVDIRDSGAAMLFIEAGTRPAETIRNAPVPSSFTPVFAVRVPAKVMEKVDPALLVAGTYVKADGNLQGICREVEGKPYYVTEVQLTRLRPLSS